MPGKRSQRIRKTRRKSHTRRRRHCAQRNYKPDKMSPKEVQDKIEEWAEELGKRPIINWLKYIIARIR